MLADATRKLIFRVVAILFVASALVYAGFALRRVSRSEEGSSNRNDTTLVCVKCGQESVVTDEEFANLPVDEQTGVLKCPKCGAHEAYVAVAFCPKCKRAIPRAPQVLGSAHVCPYCKEPL